MKTRPSSLAKFAAGPEVRPADDPIAAARTMRDFLRGTGDRPAAESAWMAQGLDEFLRSPGVPLDVCLGLKAGRGGRFDTPHERSKRVIKERAVRTLIAPLSGSSWAKAKALYADPAAAKVVEALAAQGVELPRTLKGIHQFILRVVAKRD